MASKRDVEPLDPVIFMKLPRLEQDPSASFPTGRGKPRSKTHFNYKGSYFACPLQTPSGPKPPHVHQSPEPPNLHYSTGAGSQPVLVEGSGECCPPNPTESMGPGMQPPAGAETGRDRLMLEPVAAREKWGSAGPGHPFLAKQPAAVKRAPTLAAPKPMYRAPAYFTDPRVAQPLQQRPGNAGWAVPVASHPSHPGEHRRGPHADPSLPPLHHLMALQAREKMGSPAAFSPYYTAFEQYRSPPTSPFLDAGLCSQRKVPETHRLSLDPWHKLCPPATSPVYQERPPECYPSLHKAPVFLPPLAPHMEAQSCAYRSFGFEGSRVPYTSAYLKPQAPWRYFPSPSDTYIPRAASASVVASPPPKPVALPRDAEPSRQEGYVLGSSFAFSPGGTAVSSTSRACMEPGCEQHQAEGPCWPVVVRHSSTLQPVCPQEKVPGASGGIPEAFPKGERCLGKQEPANPERRVSLTPQETPREGPRALITIGEGDTCKVKDAAKDLISPSPPASLPVGAEDPWDSEVPPPSPPMPVINKVFSLASYGDDLEGPEGSATFCREHLWGDTAPLSMGGSREPTVAVPTTSSQALVHSVVLQSQGESGHRRVPEEPPRVPPQPGSEDSSEEEALDLSLKKRAMGPGESPWVLDGEGGKEEEKDAERKVGEGEGTKLQMKPFLLRVFWDKSRFRSSASFMVGKCKILCPPPAAPSTIPAPSSTTPAPSSTTPALSSTTPAPSSTTPALSSTIPAPSSTIPALSSTIPALSSTTPASSSTTPTLSSTIPALSSTTPALSSTTPAPSSTIPALSSTIPALSSTIRAPSSTIPTPSSTIPAPSSTTPALSSTTPAPSSTIPALSSTIPAPSITIPAPSITIPTPSSTIPTLSITIPTPSSTMPALSSTIPTLLSIIPAVSSTIPALSSIIPLPFSTIPALSSTTPAPSSTIPAPSSTTPPSSTIPALSSTIPALSRIIPSPFSTIPALSSTTPAPSSTIPAPSSTIPALSSTIPVLSSTIPVLSSTIPALSSTTPPSSTIPALSRIIPSPFSTIPALSSTTPAPSSTIPAPSSTIPALSSTTPPSSTIPALSSTIPALSRIIPSPFSTIPALSSTTLSPSSTIPAPSSTTPAPSSTIPAPSSTIPALSRIIPSPFSTIPALSSTTPAPSSTIPAPSIISPTQPSSTTPAPSSTIPAPSSTIPALSRIIPSPFSTIPALSSTTPAPSSTIPAPPSSPQSSPAAPCSSSPPASPRPCPQPSPLALGEERPSLPSAGQYFTTLHAWLCDVLSYSVARSSPQLLREWLKKAEAAEQPGEAMPKCPLKAKNDSRVPEHHKAAKGKEIWLAFQDVPALLGNLLSQLETFMFACKCPFPHVVRAGAVFIPIHVVKKQLFPKLPGVSVDQVLQEHRVELRPTTLSEERHLRDLELKGCTSRMLKLLALKQLSEIYPDLLNLHWHNSIKQQLSSRSKTGKNPSK
ncbi:uncharacterized protein C15orf39 homolog isoform 1-T2 [Ara ararauna]